MSSSPQLRPATMREALIAATALIDAAGHFDARFPLVARFLRKRAARIVDHHADAHRRTGQAAASGGRWVSRQHKSGPLTTPGPAHVTVDDPTARSTDKVQPTRCGKRLTGGRFEFGPWARRPDIELPHGWYPCADCRAHLAADWHAQVSAA